MPPAHESQFAEPESENLPASHCVQIEAPEFEYVPLAHAVQFDALASDHVPLAGVNWEFRNMNRVFGRNAVSSAHKKQYLSHLVHSLLATSLANFPRSQLVQLSARLLEDLPTSQREQFTERAAE